MEEVVQAEEGIALAGPVVTTTSTPQERRAQRHLYTAEQRVSESLSDLAPRCEAWGLEWDATVKHVQGLIEELTGLQSEIGEAMAALGAGARGLDTRPAGWWKPEARDASEVPPEIAAGPVDLVEAWRRCGGLDPRLDTLDIFAVPTTLEAELNAVVIRRTRGPVYTTSGAARQLMRYR